jgi:hypothetical protein
MNSKKKVRKQFILDSEKIFKVKELVGARTETEAINKALDIIIVNGEIRTLLRTIRGKGKIRDIYGRTTR